MHSIATEIFFNDNTIKKKLFICDILELIWYCLLNEYSLAEMIAFYKKKYTQYNDTNILKSILWFDDVDLSDWPVLIKNPELKWKTVKERILAASAVFFKDI